MYVKRFNILLLFVVALFMLPYTVYAGTTSWSYSNYDYGSYVPKKGNFTEWTSTSGSNYYYWSKTYFKFDSNNVSSILDYNNGGENPGPDCDNAKTYITLDATAVPNGSDLELDVIAVVSNFPSPKFDIEDNSDFGEHDESEVVALGKVVKDKEYYMKTQWRDYRDGGTNDGGKIQAQFAMSKKGFSDYNNCTQSSVVQVINSYGKTLGAL